MESPRGEEQLLPGLEEPDRPPGPIELAARRTIVALNSESLIEERDALLCQSLISLAKAYDAAAASAHAKAYAIANLHAQLLATIDALPIPEGGDPNDPWANLERELANRGA